MSESKKIKRMSLLLPTVFFVISLASYLRTLVKNSNLIFDKIHRTFSLRLMLNRIVCYLLCLLCFSC